MQQRDFVVRHDSWDDISAPDYPQIPTMISPQERRYLYWLTKEFYRGGGRIVEVGTWLGGSSACLASGLRDGGSDEVLHCYDNYVWMKSYESRAGGIALPEGGDFHPKFKELIEGRFSNVVSEKVQLKDITWIGEPIEVLFLDAPKNKADMIAAVDAFFPFLIPGFSIVVFQDFFYSPAYEVPTTVCALGGMLSLVHTVANSSTAAFRFNTEYTPDMLESIDYEAADLDSIVEKMRDLIAEMPKQPGDFLSASLAFTLHDKGFLSRAVQVISDRKLEKVGLARLKFLGSMGHVRRKYATLFAALGL